MTPVLNNVVPHYEQLLDFAYQVINSMKGKPEPDARRLTIEHLALKIFLHAATVSYLWRGTKVTLSAYPQGAHVIDFPSAVVITRAILETFLHLFEVFFEHVDDDEFEYRCAVYELNGLKALELAVQRNPNPPSATGNDVMKTAMSIQGLQKIRERIKQTKFYQTLDPNQQKSTLDGNLFPKRKLGDVAAVAGFGKTFIDHTYMYMSSYTHGDSLSAAQTASAQTDQETDIYFQIYISLIMMVVALLISNYSQKFSEAKAICDASPNDMVLVKLLLDEIDKTK